jgi:hypothetical protein
MRELLMLQKRLLSYSGQSMEICKHLCERALGDGRDFPNQGVFAQSALLLFMSILKDEGYFQIPDLDPKQNLSTTETWRLAAIYRRQLALIENPDIASSVEGILRDFLTYLFQEQVFHLPTQADYQAQTFSVPLHSFLRHPAEAIEVIFAITVQKFRQAGLFKHLLETLDDNLNRVSGIHPDNPGERSQPVLFPTQMKDKNPQVLVQAYLSGTPFTEFFNTPMPFSIPLKERFEHMHVVGGSGHGKTQLLQSLMLTDLDRVQRGDASLIVIDSQGDMINKLMNLASLNHMSERLVYIDPTDIEYPPALNLFDFGMHRYKRYSALEQEILMNGAIALYEYVFGALLGANLTQRQEVIFRNLARLMMQVPEATIHTLMDFMQEPGLAQPYLSKLDRTSAQFFQTQFFSKAFDQTRQQILTRLYGVLTNSVLERMFSHKHNKLNLYQAMNAGSLILINTAKNLLKQEGCEILGRFFIALICQAAQERASIDERARTHTFVYIDEAHDYFDESIENLLNQARKYNVGLVIAHQNLNQFDHDLRATVMASTTTKMVGGLSYDDASRFAKEMNCHTEFLQSIRKHTSYTEFACMVRNYTQRPLRLEVPFGQLEDRPTNTKEGVEYLKACNRARYGGNIQDSSDPDPRDDPPDAESGFKLDDPDLI